MLAKKEDSKTKNMILIAVALTTFSVSGYLLYTTLNPTPSAPSSSKVISKSIGKITTPKFKKIKTDFSEEFLESNEFSELKIFGDIPVQVKSVGKNNLFRLER